MTTETKRNFRGYGGKHAADIMEKIKETAASQQIPDFMPVKACSEMLELFRGEAQEIANAIRNHRSAWTEDDTKVACLEKRKLEADFRHIYRLYWVSMKLFYPLYDRAMTGYRSKIPAYGNPTETSTIKAVA